MPPPESVERLPQVVRDIFANSVEGTPCDQYDQYDDKKASGICTVYYKKQCDTADTLAWAVLEQKFLDVVGSLLPMLRACSSHLYPQSIR